MWRRTWVSRGFVMLAATIKRPLVVRGEGFCENGSGEPKERNGAAG
jgi:hypothetical protein